MYINNVYQVVINFQQRLRILIKLINDYERKKILHNITLYIKK